MTFSLVCREHSVYAASQSDMATVQWLGAYTEISPCLFSADHRSVSADVWSSVLYGTGSSSTVVYCYSGQSWSFDVVGWEGNPLFCSDPWLMWDIWEASQAYCKPQWHGGDGWFTRVGWGKTCTWFICGIQTFSDIEGLVWDCSISSISSALAMGILQCCTKPLVWYEALSPFII